MNQILHARVCPQCVLWLTGVAFNLLMVAEAWLCVYVLNLSHVRCAISTPSAQGLCGPRPGGGGGGFVTALGSGVGLRNVSAHWFSACLLAACGGSLCYGSSPCFPPSISGTRRCRAASWPQNSSRLSSPGCAVPSLWSGQSFLRFSTTLWNVGCTSACFTWPVRRIGKPWGTTFGLSSALR